MAQNSKVLRWPDCFSSSPDSGQIADIQAGRRGASSRHRLVGLVQKAIEGRKALVGC